VTRPADYVDEINISGRRGPVRVGVFLFGGVEMPDAGLAGTPPLDRRYDNAAVDHAHRELLACGELAERLGYDSFWLTEHHFQHEGYEVVPNGLLFAAFLAARTTRLRIGTMFNVVGQWHPLRLAEDFAMVHNLSGGRGILGAGRGTVPREMLPLTAGRVSVGSYDNPSAAEADRINRETWQAVTSPPTLKAAPARGLGGVFWLKERAKEQMTRFARDVIPLLPATTEATS